VKKYRKKPVIIEAIQFDGTADGLEIVENFIGTLFGKVESTSKLQIATPEGLMTASPGDYIIKGIKGEFYPCKPDIFEASYEEALEQGL